MSDPELEPGPQVSDERKSRSIVNRPAQKQTVVKLGESEVVLADRVFESLFSQIAAVAAKLPSE